MHHVICVVLLLSFLAAIAVQTALRPFEEKSLVGVVGSIDAPMLSLRSWWNGQFQKQVQGAEQQEGWIDRNVGFRWVWLKTDNQINFSVFREAIISRELGAPVLGKDNWLYDEGDIATFVGLDVAPLERLERFAADLRRLQDELQRRGITMLVLLSPNKAGHYPEHLPDWALRQREVLRRIRPGQKSNYEVLSPLIEQQGVNCMDEVKWLREEKQRRKDAQPEYRLFARGGFHWSLYTGSLVTIRLLDRLEELTGKDLLTLRCLKVTVDNETTGTDNDLGNLLNIWTPWVTKGPTAHAYLTGTPGTWRPDVLWVGDSFSYTLTDIMDLYHVYRCRDTLFMFSRRFTYHGKQNVPIDRTRFDWQKELLTRDILIIELNESQLFIQLEESELFRPGFGFVEEALAFLDGQDAH